MAIMTVQTNTRHYSEVLFLQKALKTFVQVKERHEKNSHRIHLSTDKHTDNEQGMELKEITNY